MLGPLAENDADADALIRRGLARLVLGLSLKSDTALLEETYAGFVKAIELRPDDGMAYYGRARMMQFAGRTDLATSDYGMALKFDPTIADAYLQRGQMLAGGGKYATGIVDLDEAARLDPGLRREVGGNMEQLLVVSVLTQRHQPDNAALMIGVGIAHTLLGAYDEAIAEFTRAADASPENGEIFYRRANAYALNDQRDLAIDDLEMALEISADDERIKSRLAEIREAAR